MTWKLIIVTGLLVCFQNVFGQITTRQLSNNARFYSSYEDYLSGKALGVRDTTLKIYKDSSFQLDKYLWGIIDRNVLYRVQANNIYKVEDTSGLIVYSVDTIKSDWDFYAWVIPGYPYVENKSKSYNYYFSQSFTDEIRELNLDNLNLVTQNPLFLKKAKKKFRCYNYDIHERYKSGEFMVNRLYKKYAIGE